MSVLAAVWVTVRLSVTVFASLSTVTVTFCVVSQLLIVNERLDGLKERPVPDGVSVTFADGWEPRRTA